ncbi:MAG TPA: hypothetical protein VJC03_06070 [bacterium]|nr:hypothetical protein [bacterium]
MKKIISYIIVSIVIYTWSFFPVNCSKIYIRPGTGDRIAVDIISLYKYLSGISSALTQKLLPLAKDISAQKKKGNRGFMRLFVLALFTAAGAGGYFFFGNVRIAENGLFPASVCDSPEIPSGTGLAIYLFYLFRILECIFLCGSRSGSGDDASLILKRVRFYAGELRFPGIFIL